MAGAEPGPEQGVVTPGVQRGAEQGGVEVSVRSVHSRVPTFFLPLSSKSFDKYRLI